MTVKDLRDALADKPDELHVCIVSSLRSSKPPELFDLRRIVLVRELEDGRSRLSRESYLEFGPPKRPPIEVVQRDKKPAPYDAKPVGRDPTRTDDRTIGGG